MLATSVKADTNTVYYTEACFASILCSNLSNGLYYGASNAMRTLPNAPGMLRNSGTGPYWGSVPITTITAGLTNFASGADALLGGAFSDVLFGGALLATPILPSGTYLLTVTTQYSQSRVGKQPPQLRLKLVGTEINADVPRSERWAGPESANGDWPLVAQAIATITTTGQFKVQAYATSGNGSLSLRSAASTLSWLKLN